MILRIVLRQQHLFCVPVTACIARKAASPQRKQDAIVASAQLGRESHDRFAMRANALSTLEEVVTRLSRGMLGVADAGARQWQHHIIY